MSTKISIPLFPIGIIPIPHELIPLHIFEPRYRQLLQDILEDEDGKFGILFDHPLNKDKFGAIVKIESILKEYETGEKDIVVQCTSNFLLDQYYQKGKGKLYPAGEVYDLKNGESPRVDSSLQKYFKNYLRKRDGKAPRKAFTLHEIANMLHMESNDRLSFIRATYGNNVESFLHSLIKYHAFILDQEVKSKSKFYLN